ncbi:hypothetical protein HY495_01015 [Candidatus Woesearchaeota archaeon]|nr:hypothetical protein [Candidatus Woesearchaeota archaeon]
MSLYFFIYAKRKEDIPEIRRYLEAYADDLFTEKPKKDQCYFRARAYPATYARLFSVDLTKVEDNWKQDGQPTIPDSLDDVVDWTELCAEPKL